MMKMLGSAILLVDGVDVLCAVIVAAPTGNWASSVVSLLVLMPLAVVAVWLRERLG